MSQALADAGDLSVADLGTALIDSATNPRDLLSLVQPDLLRHPVVRTVWTDSPSPRARGLLAARLGFEADLEFGLRARLGRTLELSRAASARVAVDDLDHWAGVVGEELQRVVGSSADPLAVVPIGLGYYLLSQRHAGLWRNVRALLWPLLGALPGLLVLLAHNYVKTGHPLHTGYQSGQLGLFDGSLLAGLFGLLLSPGKGLLWFSPTLWLSVLGLGLALRTQRSLTWLVLLTAGVVTAISAKYPVWHGGYCFGPRYLVPLIPMLSWLAVPQLVEWWQHQRRRLVVAVTLTGSLGLLAAGLGSALYWDHYCRVLAAVQKQALQPSWSEDHHAFGYYVPQFSPLVGHAWLLRHHLRHDPDLLRDAPWQKLLPARLDLREEWSRVRVDLWALDWFAGPGKQSLPGAAVLAVLLLGIGGAGWGLRTRRRDQP